MKRLTLLPLLALLFASCSQPAPEANLELNLRHLFYAQPFQVNDTLRLPGGRAIVFDYFKYIVSDFRFVTENGEELPLAQEAAILDAAAEGGANLQLTVPAGSYNGLRFRVGLRPELNHRDPTTLAQNDPLNAPGMHWGWNPEGGYKFVRVEGRLDSSALGNGFATTKFSYHLATDAVYAAGQDIELNNVFEVPKTGKISISSPVYLSAFFDALDLPQQRLTESMGDQAIALAKTLSATTTHWFKEPKTPADSTLAAQ